MITSSINISNSSSISSTSTSIIDHNTPVLDVLVLSRVQVLAIGIFHLFIAARSRSLHDRVE